MTLADAQKTNRRAAISRRLILTVPLEREEIHEVLEAYVIHPDFFDGTPEDLAFEYLQRVLNVDPVASLALWALYTDVAADVLESKANPPSWSYCIAHA